MAGDAARATDMISLPPDVAALMAERPASPGRRATEPLLGTSTHCDLFNYWSSLPRQHGVPKASGFNPMELRHLLPEMAMLSMIGTEEIIQRLVGTGIAERLSYDATGTNLLDYIDGSYRRQCSRDMHEVVHRPCGWQVRYLTEYVTGRIAFVQSIYLPLHAPDGQRPRIVSVHDREEAIEYRAPSGKPVFAREITDMVWIDIGFGVPG
ncbi:MAG: PAS domain-containing protein [Alphaproteobacteria bacterium]|nr:PAS domain-containing protein [Alphaproteobacteria bacterium]MDX5417549.1 PAS domain-containing protein [Alphaproteobacteria bacterium]MDX5495033.1 PAS domain-containing protein [Alphaproteobacteria bacterium]